MKNKFLLFLSVLFLGIGQVWGQTEILSNTLRSQTLINSWNPVYITAETATGGYARFTSLSSSLTTPVFDASSYASVIVDLSVAKYGSGTDGPITVLYSLNGGTTWLSGGNSSTPTSSTYSNSSITIEATSSTMVIRLTRTNSPSEKRVRDVVISGVGFTADPEIILSNNGTQIPAGDVEQDTQNHILSTFKLDATEANATLNEAYFTTGGNYQAADVDGFKFWYNSTDNFASSVQLGSTFISTSTGDGDLLEFTGFPQTINKDASGYFWVTADISASATIGRTINLDAIAGADFEFSVGEATGTASAGGIRTIIENTAPTFVIENISNTNFGEVCIGQTSTVTGSFDFYGMNLTGNVTVGPLTGYSFSTDDITYYSPTLILTPDAEGDISEEIYIRFSPAVVGSHNGNIYITGGGGTPTSIAVTGTGVSTPSITTQPANQSVTVGTTATFNVTATEADSYQWQLNTGSDWNDIAGATSSSYTTANTTLGMDGYQYRVIVTNTCGDTTSSAAVLTVTEGSCFEGNAFDLNKFPTRTGHTEEGHLDGTSTTNNNGTSIRLASGNNGGSVETDVLIGISGTITVKFRAKGWSASENSVSVRVGTQSQTVTGLVIGNWIYFGDYQVTFENVPAGSKLRFSTSSGNRVHIGNVEVICGTPTTTDTHFRSQANGDWTNTATWESSSDGLSWAAATTYPGATAESVVIEADHTVNINSSVVTITNTQVYGTLEVTTPDAYSVVGDEGDIDLTIEDGGIFLVSSPGGFSVPDGNAWGLVKTGGKLVAGPLMGVESGTAFANAYLGRESGLFYFGNAAICEWANPSTTLGSAAPSAGNRNFFFENEPGDMPIFRVTATPQHSFGAGNNNIFYSILEIVGETTSFSVQNGGQKTFVGGVRGSGKLIMESNSGPVIIGNSEVVPELGGTATIVTNTTNDRLRFPNGANVTAGSNFTIENSEDTQNIAFQREGDFNINGTLDITNMRITNTATGGVFVKDGGALRTRHTGGLFGSGSAIVNATNFMMETGSTIDYYADEPQVISSGKEYYHLIFSGNGTKNPQNATEVNTNGSILITDNPIVNYTTRNLGSTEGNSTDFTMDGGKLIIGTGGTQPRPGGTYNITGGAIEFTGNSVTSIKVSHEYHDVIISGQNITPGGKGFTIKNILSVTPSGEINIPSTPDTDTPYVVTAQKGVQVEAGGLLTFENNANLMQDEDAVNIGDITVERFVQDMNNVLPDHMDYVYWSSPVTGQEIHDGTNSIFSPGTPKNRNYQYNEPTDYFVPTPDLTFTPGKGYAIRAEISSELPAQTLGEPGYDKTYTFTGIPNNGEVNIPIQRSPDSGGYVHGYNLVGNPYPSNIDADVLFDLNASQMEPIIYLLTNNITEPYQLGSSYTGESYAVYNPVGGLSATRKADPAESGWSMDEEPNGVIKVGQGFIIQAKEGASSLQFKNMADTTPLRITDQGFFFQRNLSQKDRFWLEQKSPLGMINSTLVGYVLGATNEFEKDYDAPMLTETSDAIYTVMDSVKLSIQGRGFPLELSDVVPLGLNHFEAGVYTIGIRKVDGIFNEQSIYLRDKQKQIVHNLSLDGEYVYEANAGELTDRFEIIYQPDEIMSTSDLLANPIKIYHADQNIVIESEKEKILSVEVYDLNGRKVHSKDRINSNLYQIRKTSLATQVFVVKVLSDGGKVETRKIINQ